MISKLRWFVVVYFHSSYLFNLEFFRANIAVFLFRKYISWQEDWRNPTRFLPFLSGLRTLPAFFPSAAFHALNLRWAADGGAKKVNAICSPACIYGILGLRRFLRGELRGESKTHLTMLPKSAFIYFCPRCFTCLV